jgi:hypothetical protein
MSFINFTILILPYLVICKICGIRIGRIRLSIWLSVVQLLYDEEDIY